MPERRKLKAPSPQFQHSTPKKKSRDSESPSDIHKVLGYSDTKQTKKGNISLDVITPEYDDGSSRPMFKKRLKPVTANAGDTVQLECEVSGSPAPKVLWLKNSKPLKAGDGCKVVVDGDKNVLIFPSLRDVDVGVYTARAMNVNGSVMCSAELLIKEGEAPEPSEEVPAGPMDLDFSTPAYFFQMSSCQVQEGRLARFDCRVVAYPRPEIVWMRDGKVVESGDRFKLLNFNNEIYSLLITNVQLSDEGRYTCWARNKFGEAMTEAYLNVIALEDKQEEGDVAPKFLTKFYDQQIMEGVPTEFKCLVDGRPEPSVTWLLNDIELKETLSLKMRNQQGMVSLELNSPQMDQSGEYTCHLSNTAGEVKCSARLTVIEDKIHGPLLPKFLRKFDHQTVREGEEAKFEVTIVGQPKPKVTWMFDHKPIPETSKKYTVLEDGDNYTLIVKNIRYEDDGKITCKAVNSEGEVYCSGNVNVKSGKRIPQEIPETPGLKQDEFDAKYGYVPTFTRRLQDQSVPEGTRAKLECKVMGIPDPEVSWMKDGRQIVPSGRYHIYRDGGTCILTVDGVTPTDSGVYTCIVSNPAGKSSTSAELKLGGVKEYFPSERYLGDMVPPSMRPTREAKPEALPSIPVDKPTILEVRPDAVKLSWLPTITSALPADARRVSYVVESRELPSSDWDKLASGVPTNTYFARNLRPDKEYEFRIRAQNLYGASEPTKPASLPTRQDETARKVVDMPVMRAPPRLPTARPVITDMGEETVRLAWRPVETFKAKKIPPVSYRLEGRELPGTDWLPLASRLQDTSHYLPELPTDRDYMIRVRAENQYGVSEPTESIWLPRARAFPGVPISRPEIIEIEPHVARLRWERVEVPAFGMDEVPLTYMLEMEEPPIGGWRTVARDLDDTEYLVEGLEPGRDYRFRVRARSPEGVMTEPSPAASIFTTLARTRAPVDRLELEHYEPDTHSMQLAWQRVDVPPYQTDEEPLLYMLEYQEPPFPEWRSLVSGIPTTRYRVMDLPEDHDYQFRVRALTPYGVSPPSPALPVSFRQLPPGPIRPLSQAPQISDIEPDALRLSWRRPMTDLTEPFRYRVEMQEPPMMDWRPVTTGLPDTSYKVTGLKPTKDYLFRVVPESDKLMLEPTPPVYLSTTPVRPRMNFREPQIKELGPDSIQLSWQPAELPAYHRRRTPLYYAVEMMELPSTNWVPVSRHVPDTSFVVKGLKPEIDYKFRVRAETDYGSSEPSLPTTVYRKPAPIFTRHEPIIQSFATDGVVLSWQPATLADGVPPAPLTYRVEVQTPPGVSSWGTLYSNVPSTSVRLADLRPDLDYLVRVRAEYGGILSEPTLPLYIPRRAVPPRIPSDAPYPVDITPDSVKLQWRSAELPIHITDYSPVTYRVEAQEGSGGEWVIVARGVPHTDFFITGLQPDKDYTFRVRAENDYGLSEPTQPVMIRRRSVAPTLPSDEPLIYDVGPGSARLSWRPASFPSYFTDFTPVTYTVLVQEPPYNTWRPLVRRIPHTSYHVTGLQPDKDYSFRIQAENAFGTSRPTEPTVLPRLSEFRAPIRYPEISDVDEDLTSLKLHWTPRKVAPYDKGPMRFRVESWEPTQRSWLPLASGIPDTTYHVRNLPSVPEHLFRVRAETERAGLSTPSLPVSLSRVRALPSLPMHSPQLYDLEPESVRLSWLPAHLPSYRPRRTVRYLLEQREMPGREWRSVASELMDTNYRITGLRPRLDYEFRVRALLDEGPTEPSPPVQLYRRPYVPHVRLETPEIFDVEDDSVGLRWSRVDVPAYSLSDEPLTFLIETQRLPDYNWQPVARGISSTDYRVSGLRPHQDYMFRVRAQYPSGVSAPSPHVPLYRRPIRHRVPISRPEIWEDEPYTAHIRWQRAYIPPFHRHPYLKYRVQMQEPTTNGEWRPVAEDLTEPDLVVKEVSPRKDYLFRIQAETPDGELSDPSPPIPYYRSQLPMSREPFKATEYKPFDLDNSLPNRTYFDHLTKYIPPRLPVEKPEMVVLDEKNVELAWRIARVPESIRHTSNLTYSIEVRNPPEFEWRELVSGLKTTNYTLKNLHPKIDYMFRVRAINEYGSSEPSLPVSLYRPIQFDDYPDYEEDEEFEREWELRFGQQEVPLEQVPPRLPMDTPKSTDVPPDSLWIEWLPARIPAYATQTPITYVVEVKQPPQTAWNRLISDLTQTQYCIEGLKPEQDYQFRVRAETQFGVSDPTLPVMLQRSRGSRKSPSVERERDVRKDEITLKTPFLQTITTGVPPRMSSNRPISTNVHPDRLTVSWNMGRVPSYVKGSKITYIIEVRQPPSHLWTVLAEDIEETTYDITSLRPEQDYMFRVKAINDFGVSEPTLPMSLFRERDDYVPRQIRSRSGSRDSLSGTLIPRRRRSSSLDLLKRSDSYSSDSDYYREIAPCAPEFSTPDNGTQYFVEGKSAKLKLHMKGCPLPTIHWYRNGEKIEYDDKYNAYVTPTGQVTLEILRAGLDAVAEYKCYAENEHGCAVRIVKLEVADPPTILDPIKELVLVARGSGKLECRIDGVPYPNIKWMKDWRPLAESARVKVQYDKPDRWTLTIDNSISMDTGLYAVVAENEAGKVHCTARVNVEDEGGSSGADSPPMFGDLNFKEGLVEDHFYILEEVGRGRHGVVRRIIDKVTGKEFAAKFIRVRNQAQKIFFRSELESLRVLNHKNIVRLIDAFETDRCLILITDLTTGGEILDRVTSGTNWTESDAAHAIKQLLETLQHLQEHNVFHLDIKPSNLHFASPDSDEVKLIDFGLSRKQHPEETVTSNYGTPEFTSPEQISNDPLSFAADVWGVGVLTYILVSGVSPFTGHSQRHILQKIQDCDWKFNDQDFENISKEAKDFIGKLLVVEPSDRLTVEECLKHPWINGAVQKGQGLKLNLDKLNKFHTADKDQRVRNAVRTTAKLQSLSKILDDKSPTLQPAIDEATGEIIFPDSEEYGEFLDEDAWYEWHTHYQQDPDAMLFPLKDTDYTLRVREYRRVRGREDIDPNIVLDEDESIRFKTMKERLHLSDLDKEDADLVREREEEWMSKPEEYRKLMKFDYVPDPSGKETPLIFRNKVADQTFKVGDDVTFTCSVISSSPVTVTWYRDEQLLSEGPRIKTSYSEEGIATLKITNTKQYDNAIYKCVARNKDGRVSCQARLLVGDVPGQPSRPVVTQVSDTQVFLRWEGPVSNGNSCILGYRVDYKKIGDELWTRGPYTIEEYALLSGLLPTTLYIFRVSCHNSFGTSPYSWATIEVRTKGAGATELEIEKDIQPLLPFGTAAAQQLILPAESRRSSVTLTHEVQEHKGDPHDNYSVTDSVIRGKFSEYRICTNKSTNRTCVLKMVPYASEKHDSILQEFNILRALNQENIITVLESYLTVDKFYTVFEKLSGLNIVQYLSLRSWYSEDIVVRVVQQILNALQYLHFMGYVHLNLQPSSIVMTTRRRPNIKLTDFALARKIESPRGEKVARSGYPDFLAPEVVTQERVSYPADFWSVGVLTFLMLSGESPFSSTDVKETLTNIAYNRFDTGDLYENVSKESIRFLFKVLKRLPRNRAGIEECLASRFLQLTERQTQTRQKTVFRTDKIRRFCREYDQRRFGSEYAIDQEGGISVPVVKPDIGPVKTVTEEAESKAEPVSESADVQEDKVCAESAAEPVQAQPATDSKPPVREAEPTTDSKPQVPEAKPETDSKPPAPEGEEKAASESSVEEVAEGLVTKAMDEALKIAEGTS